MKKIFPVISLLVALALLLSACNLPTRQQSTPTSSVDELNTAVARTVEALNTQMAPTATLPPPPTQEVTPTNTPQPTITLAPTSTAVPIPCNRAKFVSEEPLDDTVFNPNQAFTKKWTLRNTGTCSWNTSYKLVFDSGDAMGGPASVNLPSNVPPNGTITLSVNLTAPATENKTYKGNWKLQSDTGEKFGVEPANGPFWVQIKVGSTLFAVTSATTSVDNANVTKTSAECSSGVTFTFTTPITTTRAGKVIYYYRRSDGASSTPKEIEFDAAGTKSVSYTWTISGSYEGWVSIYIDKPNNQEFNKAGFKLTCTP